MNWRLERREVAVHEAADEYTVKIGAETLPLPGRANEPRIPRTPEHPVARLEDDVVRRRAFDDCRREEGVAAAGPEACNRRHVDRQLGSTGARQSDVEILRLEGCGIRRARRNPIAETIGEPHDLELGAIRAEPLLDARFDRARPFGFQVRVPAEKRRRAVRLEDRRLFDAEARARA